MSNQSENKFTRFLSGKGFYLVLGLCLAGAGTAAYLALETAERVVQPPAASQQLSTKAPSAQNWSFPPLEEAAGSQSGVAIGSSAPSASSTASAPPAQSKAPAAEQEQPASTSALSLTMPLEGKLLSPYSNGELVKSETLGDWRTHNGVDLVAAEGTPVKACAKGTVSEVRSDALWGYVVEVSHANGVVTRYCGLSKQLSVQKGDQVKLGQVLGLVGYLPAESLMEPHLHLECRQDGNYVDPMTLIA